MPDKVIIKNLKLSCRVGVPEEERKHPQTIEIDLELERDLHPAGTSDDVEKTVDYAQVSFLISDFVQKKEFKLLERLAEEIANEIMHKFDVDQIKIQVRKKVLKETDWTGVEIVRQRKTATRPLGFSPR
jgi:FolB domain-containing protein